MKEIPVDAIIETVSELCQTANCDLNGDVFCGLAKAFLEERSKLGKSILGQIMQNADIAQNKRLALCQDTGMVVVFAELGQDVHITGGSLEDAINEGVRRGYKAGYLRSSVVDDPILRNNTQDNTPAVIYYEIVSGDSLKLTVVPKGFGSENMSSVRMLKPSEGLDGIKKSVLEVVDKAGPNACPPVIVGVGIGGTMDKAALLAKKALIRPIDERSRLEHVRSLETEILECINNLGIGPAGYGGSVTALAVNIEVYPTHIAGLPVAVNMSCHATRHASALL